MGAKRRSLSQLQLAFFGLTREYRTQLFNQIHEIVFHGNGGYDWLTVYNMPIWLRRFTASSIKDYYDKQREAQEEAQRKSQGIQQATVENSSVVRPPIPKPTYTTKASTK
jgi:hypothetical protein